MTVTAATKAPIIPTLEMSRFVDIDIYGQAIKADPSPWLLQWADKPPFYVMIHGRPNAVICRHEQVKAAMANFRHRYVVKDCVVDGVPLYRGMIVHLSMGASNYDPDFYPHPNAFDIKRNPKDISTFGHATHFCVGNALARAVARTSIGRLVKHFPTMRLADPDAQVIYGGMPTERMPLNIQLRVD